MGTQRRLQALMARAWSPAAIETASGIPARDIDRMLGDERNVTPALAAAVARAYDRLWDRQPPRSTAESREAALAHACRRGWAPPLAWDDDQIDHPSGRPADGWKPANGGSGRRSALDLAEDAAWVREYGGYRYASVGEIAARLGVSRSRLEQALCRARKYASRGMEAEAGLEPLAEVICRRLAAVRDGQTAALLTCWHPGTLAGTAPDLLGHAPLKGDVEGTGRPGKRTG